MAGLDDVVVANYTKAYYEDLDTPGTWIEVVGVQSLTHPTDEANIVEVPEYGQNYARKLTGSHTTGNLELTVNFNPSEASHTYLLGEYKSGRSNNWKVEVNSDINGTKGSYYEFSGQVASKSTGGEFDGIATVAFSVSVDGALGDWTDKV